MKSSERFEITNITDGIFQTDGLPFCSIKEHVLGEDYSLSLAFVDEETSEKLNNEYRSKAYPTNILSFPLDELSGEICICLPKAEQEAQGYNMKIEDYVLFLFVHGVFHLKGMDHGDEMDQREREIRELFNIPQPQTQ